jgi:hypothetical protein
VGRFTDAISKILPPKTSEILRADPIRWDIANAVRQVPSADGIKKPLQTITELR